jgi:hypothetical protein
MILDWMAKWSPLAILLSQLPNQSALAVVRNGHFLASSLRAAAALRAMPQLGMTHMAISARSACSCKAAWCRVR